MKFTNSKILTGLKVFSLFILVNFLPTNSFARCDCSIGSNGIYVMGYEFIATSCPSANPSDNDSYRYLINPINCTGNTITKYTSYGDIIGTPASLTNFYISKGYRVLRNESGTHFLLIQNGNYPFKGMVAGINMSGLPAGVYYTDPKEEMNEYCTESPLTDLDYDSFPNCLDCAPYDPDKNSVCPVVPDFIPELNQGGPMCPVS